MYTYCQLDSDNKVFCICQLHSLGDSPLMILCDDILFEYAYTLLQSEWQNNTFVKILKTETEILKTYQWQKFDIIAGYWINDEDNDSVMSIDGIDHIPINGKIEIPF